jgi:hypothetical protein
MSMKQQIQLERMKVASNHNMLWKTRVKGEMLRSDVMPVSVE